MSISSSALAGHRLAREVARQSRRPPSRLRSPRRPPMHVFVSANHAKQKKALKHKKKREAKSLKVKETTRLSLRPTGGTIERLQADDAPSALLPRREPHLG